MTAHKRRQLLVDRPLQSRIMVSGAILPFTIFLMGAAILGFYLYQITDGAGVALPGFLPFLGVVLLYAIVTGSLVVWNLLLMSHRVAGPIYRICKTLGDVRSGMTDERVTLRDGDYLQKLAIEINEFLDHHERSAGTGEGEAPEAEPAREPVATDAP